MIEKNGLLKEKTEKEKKREEFLKLTESKIKKSEKDIWFVPNRDHLMDRTK